MNKSFSNILQFVNINNVIFTEESCFKYCNAGAGRQKGSSQKHRTINNFFTKVLFQVYDIKSRTLSPYLPLYLFGNAPLPGRNMLLPRTRTMNKNL